MGLEVCFLALARAPQTPLLPLAAWLGIAALFYLIAVVCGLRRRASSGRHARFVLLAAVVFRLTLLPLSPALSSQAQRFHWDGKIQTAGFNPYEYAPQNALFNPIRTSQESDLPASGLAASQPPLAEQIFHWNDTWLGNILGLKIVFTIFDLLVIWLLIRMLRERHWPAEWVLIYAWSPLAVFEVAGQGHVVPVAAFLGLLALHWASRRPKLAAAAAASAGSAGWFAFTLVPAVFATSLVPGRRRRWAGMTAAFVAMGIFWTLPYIWVQRHLGLGLIVHNAWLNAMATPVENASLFALFANWFGRPGALILALVTLVAVIVLAVLHTHAPSRLNPQDATLRAGFLILSALLLLLPQVHPWSVLWLLPLIVLWPEPAWIYFSVGVCLAYALPQSPHLIWAEYVPLYALLLWQLWRPMARDRPQ